MSNSEPRSATEDLIQRLERKAMDFHELSVPIYLHPREADEACYLLREAASALARQPSAPSAEPCTRCDGSRCGGSGKESSGLSLSLRDDALGVSELLDDSTRERAMYHRLVADIRAAIGEEARDVPLLDLPEFIHRWAASSSASSGTGEEKNDEHDTRVDGQ